jgi:type IV pilus assembly protein PilF
LVKNGLQKINEAGIADQRTLYLEGMVALIEKKPEKATSALNAALAIDPEYAEAHNTLGSIFMQQKRFMEAETEFIEACNNRFYQTPEKAYHNLGNLYRLQGKNKQALGCYHKATEINSDYFPSHYELSSLYCSLSKFELAAKEAEKARQISPGHPGVWLQIGKIEKALQKTPQAIEAFKQVIKLQPSGSFAERASKELSLLTEPRK